MGRPYPIEIRERVLADIEDGGSRRGAADRYAVSASFAVKLALGEALTCRLPVWCATSEEG